MNIEALHDVVAEKILNINGDFSNAWKASNTGLKLNR